MPAEAESLALRAISEGRFNDADAHINRLEVECSSPARVLWIRATALAYQSETNYDQAIQMYKEAWHMHNVEPGTLALILVEASRIGARTNDARTMRRMRIRAEHLWMEHGGDTEVAQWCGPALLNFANHALWNCHYDDALQTASAAVKSMEGRLDQRCSLTRAHLIRVRCLCAADRPSEALSALTAAKLVDGLNGGKHAPDMSLAQSWIAFALSDFRASVALAQQAGAEALQKCPPDWMVVTEAAFQECVVACVTVAANRFELAEQVRNLASRHRMSYMFRLLKLALTDQREEVRKWGAL